MQKDLQELSFKYLQEVYAHPQHHLSPGLRVNLYRAFGTSCHPKTLHEASNQVKQAQNGRLDFTEADKALGWLALLTAEKVIPIWQKERNQPNGERNEELWGNPITTIEIGKNVMIGKMPVQEAISYTDEALHFPSPGDMATVHDLRFHFASLAAVYGLEFLLLGVDSIIHMGSLFYSDSDKSPSPHDFAAMAVIAYAGFEEDNPDQKRLEFWKWWLMEAIPHAWELTQ